MHDARCPTRDVLDRISDRWTILVVLALDAGPARFGALRRAVGGISARMLTVTLRRLERDGLLERKVLQQRPPAVEYRLTPSGRSLVEAVGVLRAWSEGHWEAILEHRESYDSSPAERPAWLEPVPAQGA